MKLDYQDMFRHLMPGFFDRKSIKALTDVYEEMVFSLADFSVDDVRLTCPDHITFGVYKGDLAKLKEAVSEVDEGWVDLYNENDRAYCAMDGDKVVSFCLLDSFGTYQGLKVGAPGCVGTIPSYRKKGIGLKMVQNATEILKQEGYDISWIHYTGVGPWYAHLGYETVLKWTGTGFVD